MSERTYLQAISDGLREEMRRDKRVFVLGEDVGVYGGAFKVTLGFQEEFGPWRVLDTPLSEVAILGGATGAALMGLRPVAEMQFADFVSCAYDQLVTVAAKHHYRLGNPRSQSCSLLRAQASLSTHPRGRAGRALYHPSRAGTDPPCRRRCHGRDV